MEFGSDGIYHPDPSRRAQNRRIRAAQIGALGAIGRVRDADADIARHAAVERQGSLAAQAGRRLAAAITVVAKSSCGPRDDWLARLTRIVVTEPAAADDLVELRAAVDRFARWMALIWSAPTLLSGLPDRRGDAEQAEAVSAALTELIDAVRDYQAACRRS